MNIKSLGFQDYCFQFVGGEYVMSYVVQKELCVRVLRLETNDGHVGWGEIVRTPSLDPVKIGAEEETWLTSMVGRRLTDLPAVSRQIVTEEDSLQGLAFGLETAYFDLIARRSALPLYALLGGRLCEDVPEYCSLSGANTEKSTAILSEEVRGWQYLQIKLGAKALDDDLKRLRDVLDVVTNDQTIFADFNGALDVDTAVAVCAEFDDPGLVWEEPCFSVAENTEVTRRSGKPVMFDQCLSSLDCVARVAADGFAHSVSLKPPRLGGLSIGLAARDVCIASGVKFRIDGPWGGHIATSACLHLAVGSPRELLLSGCDLRQPLVLTEDWGGTLHLPGHRIAPAHGPGHGAAPPVWR